MMQALRRRLLYLVVTLFTAVTFAACENPFDPLDTSDEIRGLTFIGFNVSWDRWDTDPAFDGVSVDIEYFNEFGDALAFHEKEHEVQIEFYTQKPAYFIPNPDPTKDDEPGPNTFDQLIYAYPAIYPNSDDLVRIPIEAYSGSLQAAGYSLLEEAKVFVVVRVYPPQGVPRAELNSWQADVSVYKPEEAIGEETPPAEPTP